MSKIKKNEVLLAPRSQLARRRQKLRKVRDGNEVDGRLMGFKTYLQDTARNPYYGQSPETIIRDGGTGESFRKIVKAANENTRGDALLNEYRLAMTKAKAIILNTVKDDDVRLKMEKLSDADFRRLLDVDDPFTVLASGLGSAISLYQTNPGLKKTIDTLARKGYDTLKKVFRTSRGDFTTEKTMLLGRGVAAVNLQHIFGSMTESITTASAPSDIPKMVFTNQASGEVVFSTNADGDGAFVLRPAAFASTSLNISTSWQSSNNNVAYNPDSIAVTGVWTPVLGPLSASATLFKAYRALGMEVTITPITSALNSQGEYTAGILMEEISASGQEAMTTMPITRSQLPTLPGFQVTSMRDRITYRTMPGVDAFWSSGAIMEEPVNDYGKMLMIVSGAAPYASLSVKWTVFYSLQPSIAGNLIIRGSVPAMGAYTTAFIDFLRVTYPDIYRWTPGEIVTLYEKLMRCNSDDYSTLVSCLGR